MVQELVKTERTSINTLDEVLRAIKQTEDTDELATLLLMVTELYGDASCRCEELEVTYGGDTPEAKACSVSVGKSRDDVLVTYRDLISRIKGK